MKAMTYPDVFRMLEPFKVVKISRVVAHTNSSRILAPFISILP